MLGFVSVCFMAFIYLVVGVVHDSGVHSAGERSLVFIKIPGGENEGERFSEKDLPYSVVLPNFCKERQLSYKRHC